MINRPSILIFAATTIAFAAVLAQAATQSDSGGLSSSAAPPPVAQTFPDASGQSATISLTGAVPATHPFFQSLGSNGRACVTCHRPENGWSVTPAGIQQRFAATNGLDPIFRPVDGANAPNADVSTPAARAKAYSMLLSRGDIRIGLPIPSGAEFKLIGADDPYHYASPSQLSLFRRPLPATNLPFLSTVMWDGRETVPNVQVASDLRNQAADATLQHEQAAGVPPVSVLNQIVAFESGLYSAQISDNAAGSLTAAGAEGGPLALSRQDFFIGINDPALGNPPGSDFSPFVFDIYTPWTGVVARPNAAQLRQESIARGEVLFNTRPIAITNVAGLNDVVRRPVIAGTCSSCHSAPNAGSHSTPVFLDLGLTDPARRTADMPLYTLRNLNTGAVRLTTDPGRALVTGQWQDIGKFKVPTLRDLPARAPYFHNGSAASLSDVLDFYNGRFSMNLKPQEKADLQAFLNSL